MNLLVDPFPAPGRKLRQAYRDLQTAEHGTQQQKEALGPADALPRPWIPESLTPALRAELWAWLEQVVPWLNKHYTWQLNNLLPACWYLHPHLILEVATVADLRYRAGLSMNGDALEDWHRYCIPALFDRTRSRMLTICEEGHQEWPGRARHTHYQQQLERRAQTLTSDWRHWAHRQPTTGDPLEWEVDPVTGELGD